MAKEVDVAMLTIETNNLFYMPTRWLSHYVELLDVLTVHDLVRFFLISDW